MKNLRIPGKHIDLRLVELADAEFVYQLRSNEILSKYLPKIDPNLNNQIEWLKEKGYLKKDKTEF